MQTPFVYIFDESRSNLLYFWKKFQKNLMVMQLQVAKSRYLEVINCPSLCIAIPFSLWKTIASSGMFSFVLRIPVIQTSSKCK